LKDGGVLVCRRSEVETGTQEGGNPKGEVLKIDKDIWSVQWVCLFGVVYKSKEQQDERTEEVVYQVDEDARVTSEGVKNVGLVVGSNYTELRLTPGRSQKERDSTPS